MLQNHVCLPYKHFTGILEWNIADLLGVGQKLAPMPRADMIRKLKCRNPNDEYTTLLSPLRQQS